MLKSGVGVNVPLVLMLGGDTNITTITERKQRVYSALLELLAPEQRLNIAGRITQDVLGAVVDGVLPLTTDMVRNGFIDCCVDCSHKSLLLLLLLCRVAGIVLK